MTLLPLGIQRRVKLQALWRHYFMDIRKFSIFPMQPTYENVMDFLEWLDNRKEEIKWRTGSEWMDGRRREG